MMGGVGLSLATDALIAVLLVATIVYAVLLNRKLGALRGARAEMEALIARLTDAIGRASATIETLKARAPESGEALDRKIAAADGLAQDLALLLDKGGALAARLERGIGEARSAEGEQAGPGIRAPRPKASGAAAAPASPQEAELLKALQGLR